jgi:two-component system sensor histidine kinase/response regulator
MDCFELAARIHESSELTKTVILMLTSGDRSDDIARCKQLGISAYLTKPVRRAELRAAIISALAVQSPRAHAAASDAETSAQEVKAGSSLRILLTEDNIVNQRVALRILEKAGHQVAIAKNGREALRLLSEQPFDLVLMDVQMPEMDGFEATAVIRGLEKRTGRHIPIIAMTAHAMAGDRERCLAAGMDGYISKPVTASAMLEQVKHFGETMSFETIPVP